MKNLLTIFFSITAFLGFAQNVIEYNIDDVNGQVIRTNGNSIILHDSGGPNNDYNENEFYEVTICGGDQYWPGCSNRPIHLTFPYIDIEWGESECIYDYLEIYDSEGNLVDRYCNSNLPPLYGTTSPGYLKEEGCFTIRFYSDFLVNGGGFSLYIAEDFVEFSDEELTCGSEVNEYFSIPIHGCPYCTDDYPCATDMYVVEKAYWIDPNILGTNFVIEKNIGTSVTLYATSGNSWDYCYYPVLCAGPYETSLSVGADDVWGSYAYIVIDGDYNIADQFNIAIKCSTGCENDAYCGDVFIDSNDPAYDPYPQTLTTSVFDEHNACNNIRYDGCNGDLFNALYQKNEVQYRINHNGKPLTIDVKPVFSNVDVDLFVYDGCIADGGGGGDPTKVNSNKDGETRNFNLNCLYNSTLEFGKVDAVHILYPDLYDEIYAVVDGFSNQSGISEGEYYFAVTCGDLCDHTSTELKCGELTNGTTIGGNNYASYYCCEAPENKAGNWGPEKMYYFDLTQASSIELELNILGNKDLNLYLLDDCSATSCIFYSKNQGSIVETITATLQPGRYYVVVDGYLGDEAQFTLKLSGECAGKCNNCSPCFTFKQSTSDSNVYFFESNSCSDGNISTLQNSVNNNEGFNAHSENNFTDNYIQNETYNWQFPAGAVIEFFNGTSVTSKNPICRFNPGYWIICYKLIRNGKTFNCCIPILILNEPCENRPPICHMKWSKTSNGIYQFDASTSESAEVYSWSVQMEGSTESINISNADNPIFNLNLNGFPSGCYLVTAIVGNCKSTARVTIKVCFNDNNCQTELPPDHPILVPITNQDELTFSGMPDSWDSYEWLIPSELSFITGNSNSKNIKCKINGNGIYKVCLIIKKGCTEICYCWYVWKDCCRESYCGVPTAVSCNQVLTGSTKSNFSNVTDIYDNHNLLCFPAIARNARFTSREAHYEFTPTVKRPLTFDLTPLAGSGTVDFDVLCYKNCINRRYNTCMPYYGINPPGLNESVYIKENDIVQNVPIYFLVDGQSFLNPFRQNEGDFIAAFTCGPLQGYPSLRTDIIDINCNTTLTDNNGFGQNFASWYSCDESTDMGNNWGKERVYRLNISQTSNVNIEVKPTSNVDLSLYLLSSLNENNCLNKSKIRGNGQKETINITLTQGVYFIIVDGYQGSSGNFELKLSGCLGTDISDTDINDEIIKVYPNPFSNILQVDNNYDFEVELKLYNSSGQLLITEKVPVGIKHTIEGLDQIPQGTYYFSVENAGEILGYKRLVRI